MAVRYDPVKGPVALKMVLDLGREGSEEEGGKAMKNPRLPTQLLAAQLRLLLPPLRSLGKSGGHEQGTKHNAHNALGGTPPSLLISPRS